MCPTVVTDTGVMKGVKISVQKAVPNVDCAGAIPAAQPSWSMGRSTGGVGSDAAARPERRLQLLALSVTQITVHYRNSLFAGCPELLQK